MTRLKLLFAICLASVFLFVPASPVLAADAPDPGSAATAAAPDPNLGSSSAADKRIADADSGTAPIGGNNANDLETANIINLSNWLAGMALLMCVAGVCVSCALWAVGSKGQNPGQELTGKRGLVVCGTAAFCIGALPHMIGWLERLSVSLDSTGVTDNQGITPLNDYPAQGKG